jgi:hypothetical protein
MPWVGFESTIPFSERAKTVHALDCSATVTGHVCVFVLYTYLVRCSWTLYFSLMPVVDMQVIFFNKSENMYSVQNISARIGVYTS